MSRSNRGAYRAAARGGVVAIALLLTCAATSNPPAPSGGNAQAKHESATAQHHADVQGAQDAAQQPILVRIDQAPSQYPIATESEDEREWYATPDWWVAGATGALFVVTGGLWIATWCMWRTTQRAVRDGIASVRAALRSAKAAEGVLAHTEKISKSELRAYVGIDLNSDTAHIEVSPRDRSISVKVLVRNFGRTPAFRLQVSSKIEIREKPLAGALSKDIAPTTQSTLTLNPEQTIFVVEKADDIVVTPSDSNDIIAENKAIYFSGRIEFVDIFKRARWADFTMYSHEGTGGNASFWLCDTGNSTSDENEPE